MTDGYPPMTALHPIQAEYCRREIRRHRERREGLLSQDEPVGPALTAWEERQQRWYPEDYARAQRYCNRTHVYLRMVAAAALDGEPFGFTRADVEALQMFRDGLMTVKAGWPESSLARQLGSLADRIEALLPPEGA